MNRLLACTAVGLFLGLAPALAETQQPAGASQAPLSNATAPDQSSQMAPQAEPSAPSEVAPPQQSSEAPKSILPDQSADASPAGSPFLAKQDSSEWLVGNLIGQTVVNANNNSIGDVNDLITDRNGKIIAVLIGAGGFLGIGEKNVAIRFEDVKVARDENNDLKVVANVSKEELAAAPDYETLDEQQITVGETSDRDNAAQ